MFCFRHGVGCTPTLLKDVKPCPLNAIEVNPHSQQELLESCLIVRASFFSYSKSTVMQNGFQIPEKNL